MAHADYVAAQNKPGQRPVDLVRLTIAGTSGNNVYLFCSRMSWPGLSKRVGLDFLPLLEEIAGNATRIVADRATTDRGIRTLLFRDEESPEAFTNAAVTDGGTWWTRFRAAYRGVYYGATVEVLGWYDDPLLDNLSKAEVKFKGRIRSIKIRADRRVEVVVWDELDLKEVNIPPEISEDNTLSAGIGAGDFFFVPSDRIEFTLTEQWGSWDYFPQVVKIDDELIICHRNPSLTDIFTAQNWIYGSEEWETALYVKFNALVQDAADVGPWGFTNATRVEWTSGGGGDGITALTLLPALPGADYTVAFWLKATPDCVGQQVLIGMLETGGQLITTTVTLTGEWQRYHVTGQWTAPPLGSLVTIGILKIGATDCSFLVAQPNLTFAINGRSEYVKTTTLVAGLQAGRGAYGTTPATHSAGAALTEQVLYRDQTTAADSAAEGAHPVVIARDLINRSRVPVASVDEAAFRREADFIASAKFRRVIVDSRSSNELLSEVREQAMLDVWASEAGLVTCRLSYRPALPGVTVPELGEDSDFIEDTLDDDDGLEDRVTRCFVWYGLKTVGGEPADGDKPEDFDFVIVTINTTAEGLASRAEQPRRVFSRWIYRNREASALSARLVRQFGFGARKVQAIVSVMREPDFAVGDLVKISGAHFWARDPSTPTQIIPQALRAQVIEKKFKPRGGDFEIQALGFGDDPYRYIAPTGTPVYTSQTQDVKDTYGSISATGTFLLGGIDPTHRIL